MKANLKTIEERVKELSLRMGITLRVRRNGYGYHLDGEKAITSVSVSGLTSREMYYYVCGLLNGLR